MPDKSSKSDSKSRENCGLGKEIRLFRTNSGLKQRDLAALLDTHPNYISQIERDEKVPGKRLIRDFRALEESPLYKTKATAAPSMPPPHVLPRATKPEQADAEKTPHENYVEGINILGHLLANHPEILANLMMSLRVIYETHKEKK